MTGTRLQALVVVGGSILCFVVGGLFACFFDTRFLYMCLLAAALLGATFLLGIILSLPGVKQFTEKVAGYIKRERRIIGIGIVICLLIAVLGLLYLEDGYRFVTRHQTEFFWLVFFPGTFLVPYLYAVIASRLRSGP